MIKAKMEYRPSCWFFHDWWSIKTVGNTDYYQCRKCGSKKIEQNVTCSEPIDLNWLYWDLDETGEEHD